MKSHNLVMKRCHFDLFYLPISNTIYVLIPETVIKIYTEVHKAFKGTLIQILYEYKISLYVFVHRKNNTLKISHL